MSRKLRRRITIEAKNVNSPVQYIYICDASTSVFVCMCVDIKFVHSSIRIQRVRIARSYQVDILTVKRKKHAVRHCSRKKSIFIGEIASNPKRLDLWIKRS